MDEVERRPWVRDSRYLVGDDGTVLGVRGRPLTPFVRDDGYLQIASGPSGSRPGWCALLHIVVCETFHGPKPTPRHEVGHRDNVQANCAASNLRWVSTVRNGADRAQHGTSLVGERNHGAKLTADDVREIRRLAASGVARPTIAARYGITRQNVGFIVRRETWRHVA